MRPLRVEEITIGDPADYLDLPSFAYMLKTVLLLFWLTIKILLIFGSVIICVTVVCQVALRLCPFQGAWWSTRNEYGAEELENGLLGEDIGLTRGKGGR